MKQNFLSNYGLGIIDKYKSHGDVLPPIEKLDSWIDVLSKSKDPMKVWLASNMAVDCALHPESIDERVRRLDIATEEIDTSLDSYTYGLEEYGVDGSSRLQQYVAANAIYAANIAAIKGQIDSVQDHDETYEDVLQRLDWLAEHDMTGRGSAGEAHAAEFVPQLLVMRAGGAIDDIATGRLSQFREDQRSKGIRDDINKSWDSGLTFAGDSDGLVHPAVKLQIKLKKVKSADTYRRARVIPFTMRQIGVLCVEDLINGVLAENDLPGSEGRAYSSEQLDDITGNLITVLESEMRKTT